MQCLMQIYVWKIKIDVCMYLLRRDCTIRGKFIYCSWTKRVLCTNIKYGTKNLKRLVNHKPIFATDLNDFVSKC